MATYNSKKNYKKTINDVTVQPKKKMKFSYDRPFS